MKLLEQVKEQLLALHSCDSAFILAHAAWSACDGRKLSGPSCLEISAGLDDTNKTLVAKLNGITMQTDYSNSDQSEMLRWLHAQRYSRYIAKTLKMAKTKLVDWE